MKNILYFILINILLIHSVSSETLSQAIKRAYQDNPKLNAEREAVKVSTENIKISKSNFLPTMTLSGTLSDENSSKLTNRAGVEQNIENVSPFKKSLIIEQKIFQGGARAELKKSQIGYDLANEKLKKVEQDIIYEAIKIYTELVLNNQKYEINLWDNKKVIQKVVQEFEDEKQVQEYIKEHFLDTGRTGLLAGKGYYEYPNPTFQQPDFLDIPEMSAVPALAAKAKLS